MSEAKIYNKAGKETGKISLPESVFGLPWNADLVHQVVISMESNKRVPIAHTKDRSEVSGTGKKPWRQKGTGRARHGSRRSPIWRTGGVAHGPRNEENFTKKINKKMRAKALFVVLSRKFKDGEIIFVDNLDFETPKASDAKAFLNSISKIKGYETILNKRKNSTLLAQDKKDINTEKSFNNFGNVKTSEVRNLNPVDVLHYKYLLIENPKESLKLIESRLKAKSENKKSEIKGQKSLKQDKSSTEQALVESKKVVKINK